MAGCTVGRIYRVTFRSKPALFDVMHSAASLCSHRLPACEFFIAAAMERVQGVRKSSWPRSATSSSSRSPSIVFAALALACRACWSLDNRDVRMG